MKKIFSKISTTVFIAIFCLAQTATAQLYHSTPTAMTNLTEETAYAQHQLASELTEGEPEYKAVAEKLRFMTAIAEAINGGESVESAANRLVPYYELNRMQVAVRYFDASFAGTTPHRYIRNELLALIAY